MHSSNDTLTLLDRRAEVTVDLVRAVISSLRIYVPSTGLVEVATQVDVRVAPDEGEAGAWRLAFAGKVENGWACVLTRSWRDRSVRQQRTVTVGQTAGVMVHDRVSSRAEAVVSVVRTLVLEASSGIAWRPLPIGDVEQRPNGCHHRAEADVLERLRWARGASTGVDSILNGTIRIPPASQVNSSLVLSSG